MKKTTSFLLVVALVVSLSACGKTSDISKDLQAIPQNLSKAQVIQTTPLKADFYVATDGDDNNDGSLEKPFATIERAQQAVREFKQMIGVSNGDIDVAIKAGEYRTKGITFDENDSGGENCQITYRAYGDGEVVINGGVTLNAADFTKVDNSKKDVFQKEVQDKILQIDLNKYNITKDEIGDIKAFGAYNMAEKYDEAGAMYCELFFDDSRMTIARYPNNNEFLKTGKIVDNGDSKETYTSSGTKTNPDWENMKNPRGGTFNVDDNTANRMKGWSNPTQAWLFGYFQYDWADSSTPIEKVNLKDKTVTTKYSSVYGFKEDSSYYFFNVMEELDTEGEWYIDNETNILYFYPPKDMKDTSIDLSVSTEDLIKFNGANYITLDGVTIKGTRGSAVVAEGNNNIINNCEIKNVAGNAIEMTGSNNIASSNEISHTGKGGIILTGGDRETLTKGNNIAQNNLIYNWSEIYLTYQAGVALHGVGNKCSNNELYNSPHEAVTYTGNDHVIEFNIIHDVVLQSSDAGAIYAGRDWSAFGTVIKYNCIYNIGSEGFEPSGIYFDDALSGQTAYGNILINIPARAFLIGGGRDINVTDNIIINAGEAINYDDRAIAGITGKGWFTHANTKESTLWVTLNEMPYKEGVWAERYPNLAKVTDDFDDVDNINFAPNPSNSVIKNNVILDERKSVGDIAKKVEKFSTVENNPTYSLKNDKIFVDRENGDYTLAETSPVFEKIPEFKNIPFDKIGRLLEYK